MPCHRLRADLIQGRDGELSIHSGKLLSSGVSDKTMVIISRRGYRSLRGFRIGANGASVALAPGRRGHWKRAERMSPPRPDPGARPSCSSRSVFNDRGAQEPVIIGAQGRQDWLEEGRRNAVLNQGRVPEVQRGRHGQASLVPRLRAALPDGHPLR